MVRIKTGMDLALLLLLLGAVIGLLVAYDRSLSIPLFCSFVISLVVYGVLARVSLSVARSLAWAMLGLWMLGAWYLISQYAHMGYPAKIGLIHRLGELGSRLTPTLVLFSPPHRNVWATFVEGGPPLALSLVLSARGRWQRIAAAVALVSTGYALLLTASRGAWMGLLCAGALAAICWGRRVLARRALARRTWLWVMVGLATLPLIVVSTVFVLGPANVPGIQGALDSASSRGVLYANAAHLLQDYALTGIGFGDTFALAYSRYILLIRAPYLTYAHDLLLAVWLNHGVVGVLGLIVGCVTLCRLLRRGLHQGAPALFWGAALAVLVSSLHGITDATQYEGQGLTMPVFYAQLGMLVASAPERPVARRGPGRMGAAVALGLFVLLALAWPAWWGIYLVNRGAVLQARADLAPQLPEAEGIPLRAQAAAHYQQALGFWPAQTMAHRRLGLLALDAGDNETARSHLQRAWEADPTHPASAHGLGYANLWSGRLDAAEVLLSGRHNVCQELSTWAWWRRQRGEEALSQYAIDLEMRLCR